MHAMLVCKLCFICSLLLSTFWHSVTTFLAPTAGVVTPGTLKLVEGSTLVLNCTMTGFSDSRFNSSDLYFYVQPQCNCVVDKQFYQTNGNRTMILTYPNVTASDSSYQYLCNVNDTGVLSTDTKVGQSEVSVGYMPRAVTNISAVSYNFENMVVTWTPCEKSVTYSLFWSLTKDPTMYGSEPIFDICSYTFCPTLNTTQCVPLNTKCQGHGCFFQFQHYTINITASNSYATNNNTAWLMVTANANIVKPNPVENLQSTNVNSTSINVSWSYPTGISETLLPLLFRLHYTTQWNSNTTVVDVGNKMYTVLDGLVPYTKHNISVSCKPSSVGGYWSDPASIQKTTLESAPAVPPELPVGWFRTGYCSSDSVNCTATVFWQAIPEMLRNGVITRFIVTVRNTGATTEIVGGSDFYSAQISLNAQQASVYWLSVSAATDVGLSPAGHVLVSLPAAGIPTLQDVYMESTADDSGVFISWKVTDVNNYVNFTVMYCAGVQDVNTRCDSDPVNVVLPNTQTNLTLQPVNATWVYSVAGNTVSGSTGLSSNWLCKYIYDAVPVKPTLLKLEQTQDETLVIEWILLQCDSSNKARVLEYIVVCNNTATGFSVRYNVSGTVNKLTIPGLAYSTQYQVALWAVSRRGNGPGTVEQYTTKAKTVNVGVIVGVTIGCVVAVFIIIIIPILIRKRYKEWKNIPISVPKGDATMKNGHLTSPPAATPDNSGYVVSNGSANGYSVISNGHLLPTPPSVVNEYDDLCNVSSTVEPRSESVVNIEQLTVQEQLATESAQSSVASSLHGDESPHIMVEFDDKPGEPHPTSGSGFSSFPVNVDISGPPAAVRGQPPDTSSSLVDSYHRVVEMPENCLADTTPADVSENAAASLLPLNDGCHVNAASNHPTQAAGDGVCLAPPSLSVKTETDDPVPDSYNRVSVATPAGADNSGGSQANKSDVSDYNCVQYRNDDNDADGSDSAGSRDSDEDEIADSATFSDAGYQKATNQYLPIDFKSLDSGPPAQPIANYDSASDYENTFSAS